MKFTADQCFNAMIVKQIQKINWQKTALKKHLKEILSSGTTYAILALVFLLWRLAFGIKFQWQRVEPFEQPSFFIRSFYSAFTFFTLGLLLYVARFYKVLHDILVKGMSLWGLYNFIKAIVWLFLMFISYKYIVPWLFAVLNTSASILYSVMDFVLYIFPPLGISLVIVIIYTLWKTKQKGMTTLSK